MSEMEGPESLDGVAVIGMSLRVPGASRLEDFWRNLCDGVSSISFFSEEEMLAAGVPPDLLRDPSYVRARGVPEGVDLFDAGFFGFTPREAETMDPQHRVFLEHAWAVFDHAGYDSRSYPGAVGVFAGSNVGSYLIHNLAPNRELVRKIGPLQLRIRNDKDFMATLASYKLNLKGPSVNVQTACSTSLVAVCMASQSLLGYQCDLALAGGVSVTSPPRSGYLYQEGVYAPDGRCRAFDAEAEGTVLGDGVAVVLLKRLRDAVEDGDTIHAVIKGFAANNDGSLKLDYTAPSIDGQAEVITTAHAIGEIDPATVGYVEAHGTGTPLGDVIEVAALTQAFGETRKGFCALGSLKTNIGHLDAAAGVAGLIKAVLALEHGKIPRSLHFTRPNPRLEIENTPFFVNAELRDWPRDGAPRRAGISSFGVGGTNAHVVVEEAPRREPSGPSRPWQLVALSARSAEALDQAAQDLAQHLEEHPEQPLPDVAHTLLRGRAVFRHRRALVCRDSAEAARLLRGSEPRRLLGGEVSDDRRPSIAFLFPGIGDQYVGMARGLYEGEPVFRQEVDRCAPLLEPHLGLDLRGLLYSGEGTAAPAGGIDLRRMLGRQDEGPASPLDRTLVLHPVMFTIEYALARLWMSWGVQPAAMIGYSIGEYAAACLAGVFPLEGAIDLVARRARILDGLPGGAMLAVPLSEAEVAPRLGDRLSLAAVNGPSLCVVAGPEEAVDELRQRLEREGTSCRRLRATHAFHSRMLEPAAGDFLRVASTLQLRPPEIPFVSNVTGTWITAAQATDPRYWAEHMLRTVRFGDSLQALCAGEDRVLLEVGPGNALSSGALQTLGEEAPPAFPSLPHAYDAEPDRAFLAGALGRLWLSGVEPDWQAFFAGERRHRVPLPGYPFERRRFWIDPPQPGAEPAAREALARRSDPADWFYVPVWRQSAPLAATVDDDGRPWLVLLDGGGFGDRALARLRDQGREAVAVEPGTRFAETAPGRFTLDPAAPEHYRELIAALQKSGRLPGVLLHLWSLAPVDPDPARDAREQDLGFFSLLHLAQAWGERAGREPLRAVIATAGLFEILGDEELDPRRATLIGPCRVIPQEIPEISCTLVELPSPDIRWLDRVLAEAGSDDPVVALRGAGRWVEDFQEVRLTPPAPEASRLRQEGVYLITGGLGGVGLTLAGHLFEHVKARLVLVSRSPLPDAPPADPEVARRVQALRALRERGAEVLVLTADVTRREQVEEVRRAALARFGAVHGVVHAAGVPPGGLLQVKSRDTAAAVLAPKVTGTRVLAEVFGGSGLDFLLLCSSLTAVTGAFGLVDHCAANAFLDSFAAAAARDGLPVLSVGWDSWLEVGQAARAGVEARLRAALDGETGEGKPVHPLLGRRTGPGEFTARLDAGHWVVREHRFLGTGVVPATAFLEMARAACAAELGDAAGRDLVLSELVLAQPLVVPDGETREVRTELSPDGALRIGSRSPGGAEQEHLRGRVELTGPAQAVAVSMAVPAGWTDRSADLAASLEAGAVEFGPRWTGLLRELRCGDGQGWGRFELPAGFQADLADLPLHPALLDAATGVTRILGDGAYLPFACRRMRVRGPLPATVQSRFQRNAGPENELVCDIVLADAAGSPLVELEGYTLRRVADPEPFRRAAAPAPSAGAPASRADAFGITPAEGADAFGRLLSRRLASPRVLVSTRDLRAIRERLRQPSGADFERHIEILRASGPAHARPRLQTPYESPRNDLETQLVRLYQEMLGIDRVGIHDDFFDLGGNSLTATQLISRLRDEFEVDIPLRALFEAPTVGQLGVLVVQKQAEDVDPDELARALAELGQLSPEELARQLAQEGLS